ncbi:hypothetical protein UNH65_12025 [Chitinophaga sp. 180180018-2]|nr:hypothetical protein [Chitinophaga sp. 212800010-3]
MIILYHLQTSGLALTVTASCMIIFNNEIIFQWDNLNWRLSLNNRYDETLIFSGIFLKGAQNHL